MHIALTESENIKPTCSCCGKKASRVVVVRDNLTICACCLGQAGTLMAGMPVTMVQADGGYRGESRFDREQLLFVVETILGAARDRVEAEVPGGSYSQGAVESAGMSLATLYAQLTGDGMGIMDSLALAGNFQEAVFGDDIDIRQHAEAFVTGAFDDYLS